MTPKLTQISPLYYELTWDSEISDGLLQRLLAVRDQLQRKFEHELVEIRMGFKILSLVFSAPLEPSEISDWLTSGGMEETSVQPLPEKIWQLPVCYSNETGRDLEALAKVKNMSQEELIVKHSQVLYRLHFYGFLPGFMYLHGLPKELHTPRKSVPDRIVPAGSVAIGASQTGIYPSSSPGGWHLIGQTPTPLFYPQQTNPVFATVGERIEFVPITLREYDRLLRHPQKPKFR